jgi:hypothetical protein
VESNSNFGGCSSVLSLRLEFGNGKVFLRTVISVLLFGRRLGGKTGHCIESTLESLDLG